MGSRPFIPANAFLNASCVMRNRAELDVGADPRAIVRIVEQHAPCVLALCLGTERIHGGDQSDMLHNTRVKVV